jgi:PAS domain S-box-containing protein
MKPANSLATDKRDSKRLITSLVVVVLAAFSLLSYLIWSGYREAIREAETKTRNYAAIIEARLDATLRRADAEVQALVRALPAAALSQQAVPRYVHELDAEMHSRLNNFEELDGLRVFDTNGDLLYTSDSASTLRANIADRGHFRELRDNPQAGLVLSKVVIARMTGRQNVFLGRALQDGQGAFRGVVVAGLDLGHFQKLFQSLDLGAHGVVSIYRSDDFTPVVRWPMVEGKIDTPLPPGNPARAALAPGITTATIEFSSSTDGMVRIYSFHVLDRYPFFVTAGLAREDVLAGWRARAMAVGLSGLLLLGLLAGLLYWLWRAEAALKANEELMRTTFEEAAVGIAHIAPGTYRILMANDKFCDLLGYTQHELIGTDSRILTPADDMAAREAESAQVMAGEIKMSSSERRLIRKDGASLWINRSLSLVRDPAGQPQYFISVIEDITERKRAEHLLTLEHAVVRSLANANSESAALKEVIRSICETQGWECGRYLRVDEQAGVLRFSECWSMPGEAIEQFIASKREVVFDPGVGLAGRAWQSGQPAWIADISNDARALRAALTLETGMHGAFHFPVISEGKTIGVLAFNSRKVREPDDRLLEAVNAIGSQIGQFLQHKQAEEVRAYLSAIVASSNDAIISRSLLDEKILSWNAGAERLFGYTADEAIGQSISMIFPPDREEEIARNRGLLAQGIAVIDLETERFVKGGRRVAVSLSQFPIKDEHGVMVGVALIFHNITERKQAEDAQRQKVALIAQSAEKDRLLRLFYELPFVGLAVTSPSSKRWLQVNDYMCEMLGYPREELLKLAWTETTHPDDLPANLALFQRLAAGEFDAFQFDKRFLRKDGEIVDTTMECRCVRRGDGSLEAVVIMVRNITEQKRSEEALRQSEVRHRQLFESSRDALLILTPPSWRFTGANQAALDLFGAASGVVLTELGLWNLAPERQPNGRRSDEELQEVIATSLREGKHYFEWECKRLDGSLFPVDILLTRMKVGGEVFLQGTVRDITERKRAEQQFAALNAELEVKVASRTEELAIALEAATESDRLKSDFMANVTHELRTPLNSVIGFAELLKDEVSGPLNAKQAQFAADIFASGQCLLTLVEGILEMSRLDAAGAAPEREPVEIGAALEERVAAYRKAAEARGIAIQLDVAPDAGRADLDPQALRRMLDALLDNAIKFDREGGAVAVSARRAGGAFEIAVADTGIGIARADLAKLFKPLVQLDTGLARGHDGVGLGLALARRLAKLHGGTIEVESEPGKGSTFTLRLPIHLPI